MRHFFLFFFYIYVVFLLFFCKSSIISKKELKKWNETLENTIYVPLNDLYFYEYNFKEKDFKKISDFALVKKDTKLKIQLESQEDWLRIRVVDSTDNLKENLGYVVFYVVSPDEEVSLEEIQKIIDQFINQFFQKVK